MAVRGHDDLRVVLEVVFGGLRNLQWREFIGDGQTRVAVGDARIFGLRIYDAMVIDAGIRRLRLHLRGWLPITVRTLEVGLKLSRYPGLLGRALHVHAA
ncbi:MAG TPA: nuclear transport factor 2 family protein [Mycobacterium sp.]|nr:nuclear transport factor 2 family protein [Mycobacterium sp.]